MQNCDEIVALLSEYLDKDLPQDTCQVVERHLISCERCSKEAESLRRTVALCRQYRSDNRPGPLPPDKHKELAEAFEKVLAESRKEQT